MKPNDGEEAENCLPMNPKTKTHKSLIVSFALLAFLSFLCAFFASFRDYYNLCDYAACSSNVKFRFAPALLFVCKRWLKVHFGAGKNLCSFIFMISFFAVCCWSQQKWLESLSSLFRCVLLHKIVIKWKISPTWAIERFNCIANETQWCFVRVFRWFINSFDVWCWKDEKRCMELVLSWRQLITSFLLLNGSSWVVVFPLISINDNDIIHHSFACLLLLTFTFV